MQDTAKNTDTELWRGHDDGRGDYYADRVFVTGTGGIGFDVGGCVMVKTPKLWHEEVNRREHAEEELECAHRSLDKLGAPRERDGEKLSIVGRIYAAVEAAI